MSLILNIDCSTEKAFLCLSENGSIIECVTCNNQKDHASFIHESIHEIMVKHNIPFSSLNTVAVSNGPGSYTGLRVALSSAKGLCYALSIPLITISSLKVLAYDIIMKLTEKNIFICPMIDARRMEVFTVLYDENMREKMEATNVVLTSESFNDILENHKIIFTGNGSEKFRTVCKSENGIFLTSENPENAMTILSNNYYKESLFSDLISCDPQYIKDFKAI